MTGPHHQLNEHKNEVIAVCSAVGGVGRTTITVNLAALSAMDEKKVGILDGDLQFGDAALALDLKPEATIKTAVEKNDIHNSIAYCLQHESGINLLAAPSRPEFADLITTEKLGHILQSMTNSTELLLVDTQPGLTEHNISLLERADRILIVTIPGMAAVKNTKLMIETLAALGWKEKVSLIINRSTSASVIDVTKIPALLEIEEVYFLPEEYKYVPIALDKGIPIVTSHPKLSFSKEMENIAEKLFLSGTKIPAEHNGWFKPFMNKFRDWRRKDDEFISKTSIKGSSGGHNG